MDDPNDMPEFMKKLVFAAVDPHSHFRRSTARALVREFYRRFGDPAILDLLIAVDNMDRIASAVLAERSEIENYAFAQYGVFDEDLFVKFQMTEAWQEFTSELVHQSGLAAARAIDQVMKSEGIAEEGAPQG